MMGLRSYANLGIDGLFKNKLFKFSHIRGKIIINHYEGRFGYLLAKCVTVKSVVRVD